MYVCVCVCMCVCEYMCLCVCICMYVCVCVGDVAILRAGKNVTFLRESGDMAILNVCKCQVRDLRVQVPTVVPNTTSHISDPPYNTTAISPIPVPP